MRPVAILFANFKGNVGDFAIFDAMLRSVAARHPGQPIRVYPHGFLPIDPARMAAFESPVPFALMPGLPARQIRKWQSWLAGTPVWPGLQSRAVAQVASAMVPADFADCEAIYTAGGDQWSGFRLGATMFGAVMGLPRGVPLRTFPFSVHERFARHHRASDLREYFGRFEAPLLVRDSASQRALSNLEVRSDLVPDCVYGLREAASAVAPATRNEARVVIAVTDRQSRQPAMHQALPAQLKGFAHPVEHLTTCWSEDSAHLRTAGVEFREPLTWQETVAEFKTAQLVVTNRLHGLILGTLAGAAVVPVTNRGKAASFARDAGLTVTLNGTEEITATKLADALKQREEILAQLQGYLGRLLPDGVEISG